MRKAMRAVVVVVACLVAAGVAAQSLPEPDGRVNDFAGVLSPADREALAAGIAEVERGGSAEVAVVTMRTLGGRTVEDYAEDLFNTWGIGSKDLDNGVLILVAVDDRAMRIEVGYGLEGVLPDGLAGAIIRETFIPRFQEDNYRQGILDGTARVLEVVARQQVLTEAERVALDEAAYDASRSWGMALMASIFIGVGAFTMGTAAGAKVLVQMIFGAFFAGMALFMSLLGAPKAAIPLLFLFAAGVAILGFVLGRRPKWRRSIRGRGKGGGGSGWMVTRSGGSSGSSSSSGGSFGGGSSGGGGASGRW